MRARPLLFAVVVALAFVPVASAVPDKEADEAIKTFKKAIQSKDDKARLAAVNELAPVQHRWVAEALASPLDKDAAISVRVAAAKGLGAQWSPKAIEILAKPFTGDEEIPQEVTLAIIDALGATESDAAVATLVDFLVSSPHAFHNNKSGPPDTQAAASHALAALRHTGSSKGVGDLVDFINDERTAKRGADKLMAGADAALATLTGEKLRGAKAWRDWWSANGESAKTVKVWRCQETGKTWDKVGDAHCPVCAEKLNTKCSVFLRTRYVNSSTGEESEKKKK